MRRTNGVRRSEVMDEEEGDKYPAAAGSQPMGIPNGPSESIPQIIKGIPGMTSCSHASRSESFPCEHTLYSSLLSRLSDFVIHCELRTCNCRTTIMRKGSWSIFWRKPVLGKPFFSLSGLTRLPQYDSTEFFNKAPFQKRIAGPASVTFCSSFGGCGAADMPCQAS